MKSAEVYRYQIQRLVDDTGSGRLSALSNYEPWNGKPGHHPKPYPLFDSAKDAEAFIRRKRIVARWQRYTVDADGSLGWTAGAGEIIDARPSRERGKGLIGHWRHGRRGRTRPVRRRAKSGREF